MSHRFSILAAGILTAIILISAPVHAASTGTVTIQGAVPPACDVVVLAAPGAATIADISIGTTNLLIATVTESCNDPDGYKVTVAGTNSGDHTGKFRDSVSGATHNFTITYNGSSVPVGGIVTSTTAPGIGVARSVQISYGANNALPSTASYTYSEVLTFTIAAK